jgi:hypothetical protein
MLNFVHHAYNNLQMGSYNWQIIKPAYVLHNSSLPLQIKALSPNVIYIINKSYF